MESPEVLFSRLLAIPKSPSLKFPNLLIKILKEDYYKKDYNQIPKLLLNKPVKYEDVISVITNIIENNIFES